MTTEDKYNDILNSSKKKSDLTRLPNIYTERLQLFIQSLLNQDVNMVENAFRGLVGAGRGLTPAADDAMIGALAGSLIGFEFVKQKISYADCVKSILSHLRDEKLTTEISCKYLKCACRGYFSQDLCKLVFVLTGEKTENILTLLEKIAETGHSSGMDMLYGLHKTLEYIQKYETKDRGNE